MLSELVKRILSACFLLIGFLCLLYFLPKEFILIVVLLLLLIASFELGRMLKVPNLHIWVSSCSLFYMFSYIAIPLSLFVINSFICVLLVMSVLVWPKLLSCYVNKHIEFFYALVCLCFFGVSFSYLWQISVDLLLVAMALVWATDIMAFFIGKLFGKTKCFVPISPNKSLQGVVAGVISALLVSYLFIPDYLHRYWVLFGLTAGLFTVFGDLFESLIKRRSGVKDSGSLIPGHGGILDRIDGLILAMPVFFVEYKIIITL